MNSRKQTFKDILIENTYDNKSIRVSEILSVFGRKQMSISRATIYNYLKEFEEKGWVEKHNGGYVYVGEKLLEKHEARILADAIISSQILTDKKKRDFLYKIALILGKSNFKKLFDELYYNDVIRNRSGAQNEKIYYVLNTILEAKSNHKKISFKYQYYNKYRKLEIKMNPNTKEDRIYRVSPYTLVWQNDLYYLIGNEENTSYLKHFRIDRIVDCSELTEDIIKLQTIPGYEEGLDLDQYLKKCFYMYGASKEDDEVIVKLRIENTQIMINKMVDKFGEQMKMFPEDDENLIVIFKAFLSEGLKMWIRKLEGKVEVLKPGCLRNEI